MFIRFGHAIQPDKSDDKDEQFIKLSIDFEGLFLGKSIHKADNSNHLEPHSQLLCNKHEWFKNNFQWRQDIFCQRSLNDLGSAFRLKNLAKNKGWTLWWKIWWITQGLSEEIFGML